jgi:plastocyanin
MRWLGVVVGVSCAAGAPRGAAQATGARVSGRITMLEKKNKPSRDLGAAVVFLAGAGHPAPPVTVDIAINDKEFAPRVVVVPLGSTVRFPNNDPFDHNVFSASDTNPFDLGQYGRGESKGWAFARGGLVRVFCNVHPRMVAFVHVLASPYYTQPGADGTFAIDGVPPGLYTLHVWHERSPEVTRELSVAASGASDIQVQLDARGFRWVPHKNKYGDDYPEDVGERY